MEKIDAFIRLSIKIKLFVETYKPLHFPLVHQQCIGKTTQVLFMLLKLNELLKELKNLEIMSVFYENNLTMVFLFQNMRSLVSYRKICAPDHVQFQLSVRVLNILLGSYYI